MELRQLRYFAAVAEELNFRKAARRLNVSQPPISRQIALLEEELGTKLFDRKKRGIALSAAGTYFLEGARRILAELSILGRRTRLYGDKDLGRLRLACVGSMMYSFFPELLAFLEPRCGGIGFDIVELSTEDQALALLAGEIDLGFLRGWVELPGLRFLDLGEEALAVICPSKMAELMPAEGLGFFADRPFIAGSAPGLGEKISSICLRAGFVPRKTYECAQFSSILRLVAAGLGWSIAPEHAFAKMSIEGVKVFPLGDSVLFGVAHRAGPLPEVIERIIGLSREFIGAMVDS